MDLNATIKPGVGVGEVNLLDNISVLRKSILNHVEVHEPGANSFGPWEISFVFPDWNLFSYESSINIYSSIYNGLIIMIELTGNYKGSVNGISIGASVRELLSVYPTLTFDDEILEVPDLDLQFEIDSNEDFNSINDVLDNKITSITIHCKHHMYATYKT
jgi:hypothetical protein